MPRVTLSANGPLLEIAGTQPRAGHLHWTPAGHSSQTLLPMCTPFFTRSVLTPSGTPDIADGEQSISPPRLFSRGSRTGHLAAFPPHPLVPGGLAYGEAQWSTQRCAPQAFKQMGVPQMDRNFALSSSLVHVPALRTPKLPCQLLVSPEDFL